MRELLAVVLAGILVAGCAKPAAPPTGIAREGAIAVDWTPIGPGGGGGIYSPSISPHDANLVFVASDMGGWFRSTDGGRHWRMCDGRQVRKVNFPAVFHPTDPNVIYVGTRGGVKRSSDRGETWQSVAGEFNAADPDSVQSLAIDPRRPHVILAGFSTYLGKPGEHLVRSDDAGRTWQIVAAWPAGGKPILKILFSPKAPGSIAVATAGGFYRSDDDGATWSARNAGLANTSLRDAAAGFDAATGVYAIFLTLESRWVDGRFSGGIVRSLDGGDTWMPATHGLDLERWGDKLHQYHLLAMSPNNPRVVSVTTEAEEGGDDHFTTAYRSENGGESWRRILVGTPQRPDCNVEPDWLTEEMSWWWGGLACGFGSDPRNPDDLLFTDWGRAIRSTDGGTRWFPVSSRRVGRDAWDGRGLEVTTSYSVSFDPFDRKRMYVTYTDFGLMRSIDGGRSWIYGARRVPWSSNCYELAFDPERRGVVFGAWSRAHDLMHWKMINRGVERLDGGGLARSDDHGETWTVVGGGTLPDRPATTIVLDPRSPVASRTLYAGFLGKGVYKSTDGGATWAAASAGLGSGDNMAVWRLALHPDGTLLCGISLNYRDGKPVPGGLYRSRDGAETWERVREFPYLWGVQMDPRDSNVIYVSGFDVPPPGYAAMGTGVPWPESTGGGIFKTTDGGATWSTVFAGRYCWDVTIDPATPDTVYAGTFVDGVLRSDDAGKTWRTLTGLPFVAPHRVTISPENPNAIYVTTFGGGAWKGRIHRGGSR